MPSNYETEASFDDILQSSNNCRPEVSYLLYIHRRESKRSFPGLSCSGLIHMKDFKLFRTSSHDVMWHVTRCCCKQPFSHRSSGSENTEMPPTISNQSMARSWKPRLSLRLTMLLLKSVGKCDKGSVIPCHRRKTQ